MSPCPGMIRRLAGISVLSCLAALASPVVSSASAAEYKVPITTMRYGAIPPGLKVGDAITWDNRDTVPHTVTARDKSFDIRIAPRKQVRMVLTKAGAFAFYCILHPAMRGTLKVAAQ